MNIYNSLYYNLFSIYIILKAAALSAWRLIEYIYGDVYANNLLMMKSKIVDELSASSISSGKLIKVEVSNNMNFENSL